MSGKREKLNPEVQPITSKSLYWHRKYAKNILQIKPNSHFVCFFLKQLDTGDVIELPYVEYPFPKWIVFHIFFHSPDSIVFKFCET